MLKRKLFSILLVGALFLSMTTFPSIEASAMTNSNVVVDNINFIEVSDNKFEYTYEKDGNVYKNVEFIDDGFIQSYIYKHDESTNEYNLVDKFDTVIAVEDIVAVSENIEVEKLSAIANDELSTFAVQPPPSGGSGFTHTNTIYSSSKPTQFTIAALAVTIAAITKVPKAAQYVANLAALYYSFGKDVVYFRTDTYSKGSGLSKDVKSINQIYLDSSRTKRLGTNAYLNNRKGSTLLYAYLD